VVSPRLAPIVAVALLALPLHACTDTDTSAAPLPTIGLDGDVTLETIDTASVDSVVMVGDSITVASTEALEQRFAELGFDEIVIEAQNSKRMAESFGDNASGAAIARFITGAADDADADAAGDLWVVALGTNDINQYSSPDDVAAAVNEVLDSVPDESPVVWVDTYYRDRADGAAMVNEVVASRLERRGNAVVAPWSAYAAGDGVLIDDGVHPTSTGEQVFASVVAATASRFLRG
jgi:lysophospholipase L1-like esterase